MNAVKHRKLTYWWIGLLAFGASSSIVISYAGPNPPRLPLLWVFASNGAMLTLITVLVVKHIYLLAALLSAIVVVFALMLMLGG